MSSFSFVKNFIKRNMKCIIPQKIIPVTVNIRSFHSTDSLYYLKLSPSRELKFRLNDKVPESFRIIYRSAMDRYVTVTKHATTIGSAIIATAIVFKVLNERSLIEQTPNVIFHGIENISTDTEIWFVFAGMMLLNAAIQMYSRRFPYRIYKNDKKYIAVFEGSYPFAAPRLYPFEKGQLIKSKPNDILPWSHFTYRTKNNQSMILLLGYFKSPSELVMMMDKDTDNKILES